MKKYKNILNEIKDNFLLELSKYRQSALIDIKGLMTSLLGHLIMIDALGKNDPQYKKHMKEIADIRENIKKYNVKRNNKRWFDEKFLINLSADHVDRGIAFFKQKYPKRKISKNYASLKDFSWFSIYNNCEFDDLIKDLNL